TTRYANFSKDELIRLLERRDARQRYGLIWEREGIERDRAVNDDFVVLDLVEDLSTPRQASGWQNFVIEGDNWDALRALRLTHAGSIKCILIDPPYNTGAKDFTYNDSYVGKDDRFRHSLWLEFLYKRLILARDLLADDGVILVCINDENRARLDLLMEQVFPGMRVGSFVWRTKDTNNSDKARSYSGVHEHILIYANGRFSFSGEATGLGKFRLLEGYGDRKVRLDPITKPETYKSRPGTYYPIQNPITGLWYPCAPNRVWAFWSETKPPKGKTRLGTSIEALVRAGEIYFPPENEEPFFYPTREALDEAIRQGSVPRDGRNRPLLNTGLPDLDFWVGKRIAHGRLSRIVPLADEHLAATKPVGSWIAGISESVSTDDVESLRSERQGSATTLLEKVFGDKRFSFPKPLSLFQQLIRSCVPLDGIVLDFFAGSGTAAHAVLSQNAEDDGNRRFIMVSNTEATTDEPDKNLCRDVCATRIRSAIDGYADVEGLGGEFAYLRTRHIEESDIPYDLDAPAVWTLIQLRHGLPLTPYDSSKPVQMSVWSETDDVKQTIAYAPLINERAIKQLDAIKGLLTIYTPTPAALEDKFYYPSLAVEAAPDRFLAEFRYNVVGL
ncbi:site-specific DNA-methyltransferase, partial [Acidiphilium sp. PM]|uniref:site-specific DNA-methyltransferase n=1 Tax=Acidiphilium sp. PM TaxID=1043206 RepID=UPI0002145CE0